MPISRRRYTLNEIISLKYNKLKRDKEISSYYLIEANDENINLFIDDYVDYVVLYIILSFRNHFLDERSCDKLIDIVDGYYFCYEIDLFNAKQLFDKLQELMLDWLGCKSLNGVIAIYEVKK